MGERIEVDVAVLGAGPAGAAAARTARAEGLSVALIDRAVFPRHKLCGALVSPRAHKSMDTVFGFKPEGERFLISRQMAFKWDGEELARFDAPYDLTFTYRKTFDHWLMQAALDAGALDFQGCRVDELNEDESRLLLADGREIGYGVLIAADGAASPTAKQLFGQAFNADTIGFAFEAEVAPGCAPGAECSIDFDVVSWGYGWVFPKKDSRTIGLGAIQSVEQDLKERIRTYLAREGADPDAQKIKGAFIPLGDYVKVPGRGNILLAGDAAAFVDSLTGEGIAFALESGAHAAQAAAEVLGKGAPETALGVYHKRISYIQAELDKSNRIRQLAYSSSMREAFKGKLGTSTNMRAIFFDLLAGELSYAEIEKRLAKDVLAKLGRGFTGWPKALAAKLKR
jgi:geranylgeranyl reductase family protein